jgi:hypothetical protein
MHLPARWDPEFESSSGWNREEHHIQEELQSFRCSLTPEEVSVFDQVHRLSSPQRTSLLSRFSPEDIRARGWRFSDEPVVAADEQAAAAATHVRENGPQPQPPPRSMRVSTILMDLWHHSNEAAFLLELEACVDGLTHGVNFLFNGRRHTARFQRNHGSAAEATIDFARGSGEVDSLWPQRGPVFVFALGKFAGPSTWSRSQVEWWVAHC